MSVRALVGAMVGAALLVSGCGPVSSSVFDVSGQPVRSKAPAKRAKQMPRPKQVEVPVAPRRGTALAVLQQLPVKGRAPQTGYTREQFGSEWADVDDNGCDTRNDILQRDLTQIVFKPGEDCLVATGVLRDPYTGKMIHFVRGPRSSAVQIDHVVALSNAWQTGAQQLPETRRERFANDPLNLLAVDGPTNMSKGDGDAATWLPPRKTFRCRYVARQVAVKYRYRLWVTAAEKQAIRRILTACPSQRLPTR